MSWFKVDDALHSHPKARRAGAAALGIWTAAGSYAMAYKTGGFVPAYFLNSWGKTGSTAAVRLVEAGLWEVAEREGEPGYVFHDWDDYQPTPDEIEKGREDARERQRRRRQRLKSGGRDDSDE